VNKTIFVLLDACQYAVGTEYLGYLEHLIDYKQGAKYRVKGELPSMSRPMYTTLMTGLPTYQHGIVSNDTVRRLECESVFSLCKQAGGTTAAAAYFWMSELFRHAPFLKPDDRIQLSPEGDIDYGIFYWDDLYPDSHLFADGEYLRKAYQPDFLMYHSMGIDEWGHLKGSESQEFKLAVLSVGDVLSRLIPQWLADGYQVVVTGDHGINEVGLHGGTTTIQTDVPLYILSDRVEKGRFDEVPIAQLNVAPLLCELLGIKKAEKMTQTLQIKM
jgi:predicted AlkP superfamily pyrophosphatase or phosphodiesterase